MIAFIDFLQSFGNQMLEHIWFPLLVWTIIAVPVAAVLHRAESISPVYQYHSRMALALALPLGIGGSYLAEMINSSMQSSGTATFIVIQNPVSISASAPGASKTISFSDPMLLLGISGLLLTIGSLFFISRMLRNYFYLKRLDNFLDFRRISQCPELVNTLSNIDKRAKKTLVAYSAENQVPFTYGWQNTKIVIPADLKNDTEALSMAVQHELMHIKHRDFLLNGLMVFIKAIFWFHPLVHYLHRSGQEYREITCDGEVLANNRFSKKQYASLLFELAKREHQTNLAMSMAVNPSSLKKRIKIMSSHSNISTKFRSSFLLTLTSAALMVLAISCTDIADNGITNTELEKAQSQMAVQSTTDNKPLYIVNGEKWKNSDQEEQKKLSRLKTKYIKSIEVLKGQKATDKYGDAGKNGVIEMTVNNPEKAFSDLKDTPPPPSKVSTPENPSGTPSPSKPFYVAVDDMPDLEGGLAGLQKQITYPESAREAGIEGRVIVQFIVNKQGEVENPQIIRGIGGGADKEALRVVKQAQFTPGMQNGQPVRVQYSLPITFRLASDNGEQG